MDTKNFVADMAMGPIDSLESLKKNFPHDISFWVRVDGVEFGALPPDKSKPAATPKVPKSERRRFDSLMGIDMAATFKSMMPGELKTYTLPQGRSMHAFQHAWSDAAMRAMGEHGWVSTSADGSELIVMRRKVRVSPPNGGRKAAK